MAALPTRLALIAAVLALAVAVFASEALAAPGDLDPSFNGTGKLVFAQGALTTRLADVAIQADGKIVLVGDVVTNGGTDYDLIVTRLNPNGTPDQGFGTGGTTQINSQGLTEPTTDTASAVVIQPDGKILVAGSTSAAGHDFGTVARLTSGGALDPSFSPGGTDGSGIRRIDLDLAVNDIALDASGRILLGGSWDTGTTFTPPTGADAFVLRLKADGSDDPTFSGGGLFVVHVDYGGSDAAARIAVQPDGKVVLAGWTDQDVAVSRVTPEHGIDTGFASAGKRTYSFGGADFGSDVAIEPSGKIDVAGYGSAAVNMLVTRLTSTGALDNSLNGKNTVDADFGGSDAANAIALQANGKIVLGGDDDHDIALVRFQPGGLPDETFGPGGKRTVNFAGVDAEATAMALQPDGKIVLAGLAGTSAAVVRVLGDPVSSGGGPGGGGGGGSTSAVRCAGHRATIVGTNHRDKLKGTRGADVIVALGGNDSVNGGGGNDIICGGDGNDTVKGGSGSDKIYGQAGKDKLYGQAGNDKMSGGAGNDSLSGGVGKDKLAGGAGKDKDNGGSGNDSCSGKDSEKSC